MSNVSQSFPLGTDVNSTSIQRWFNIISLKWRGNNVDSTSVCPVGCLQMRHTHAHTNTHGNTDIQYWPVFTVWQTIGSSRHMLLRPSVGDYHLFLSATSAHHHQSHTIVFFFFWRILKKGTRRGEREGTLWELARDVQLLIEAAAHGLKGPPQPNHFWVTMKYLIAIVFN